MPYQSLEEYGAQKSAAITVAKRLAEFLGAQVRACNQPQSEA